MKLLNKPYIVILFCLALIVAVFATESTTSQEKIACSDAQVLAELQKTNQLLVQMDGNLQAIHNEMNNTRNTISVKEHLEDIKDLLRSMQ